MLVQLLDKSDQWRNWPKSTKIQQTILTDLELKPLIQACSQGDDYIAKTIATSFFHPLLTQSQLVYRQQALQTALKNPQVVQKLYTLTTETLKEVRRFDWSMGHETASFHISNKSSTIGHYLTAITQIMALKSTLTTTDSEAWRTFFDHLNTLFPPERFSEMTQLIDALSEHDRLSFTGQLNTDLDTTVSPREIDHSHLALTRLAAKLHLNAHQVTFEIAPRDDNATEALERYQDLSSYESAKLLIRLDQILHDFFAELKAQSAWLVGLTQLAQTLDLTQTRHCYPTYDKSIIIGLKNITLILNKPTTKIIENDLTLNHHDLLVITGANQGGKTTLLRALGQSQLMASTGMFVLAKHYATYPYSQVITHFKREEDQKVVSGKLDEELKRMSTLIDAMDNHALLLMNESFASTNEHEGSIINYEITKGLLTSGVTVVSVTHQYEYTQLLSDDKTLHPNFIQAQRQTNGQRTFKLVPGKPTRTSYGLDLFNKAFDS